MEDFDKQVNDFEEEHNVEFTQTHINVIQGNPAGVLYSAVLFYRGS